MPVPSKLPLAPASPWLMIATASQYCSTAASATLAAVDTRLAADRKKDMAGIVASLVKQTPD